MTEDWLDRPSYDSALTAALYIRYCIKTAECIELVLARRLYSTYCYRPRNAIASVRLSVRLYILYLLNRLTFVHDLLHVSGS